MLWEGRVAKAKQSHEGSNLTGLDFRFPSIRPHWLLPPILSLKTAPGLRFLGAAKSQYPKTASWPSRREPSHTAGDSLRRVGPGRQSLRPARAGPGP